MGNHAKVALVFAQTDPELKHKGMACFLVDTDAGRLPAQPRSTARWACTRSDTAAIALDDVFVPDDQRARRGRPGLQGRDDRAGLRALQRRRGLRRASARAASTSRSRYATERKQFDRPIASFQLVQAMIAEMRVKTDAARMLTWRAGWLKDTGQPNTTETSIAKLFATEAAVWCANEAIQVHGGAGYVDDHPVERYFRDVRVTTLYEGTSQIQKLIIGRAETGINALVLTARRSASSAPGRWAPASRSSARRRATETLVCDPVDGAAAARASSVRSQASRSCGAKGR